MKRILGAIFGFFAFFEFIVLAGAATYQPRNIGVVRFSLSTMTVTAINTSTAAIIGDPVWCYNCAAAGGSGTVCYSTSTSAPGAGSDYVLSTGTICK